MKCPDYQIIYKNLELIAMTSGDPSIYETYRVHKKETMKTLQKMRSRRGFSVADDLAMRREEYAYLKKRCCDLYRELHCIVNVIGYGYVFKIFDERFSNFL